MVASPLADEVVHASRGGEVQELLGHKGVVDKGRALPQQAVCFHGEQIWFPGAGPDEIHGAGRLVRQGKAPAEGRPHALLVKRWSMETESKSAPMAR